MIQLRKKWTQAFLALLFLIHACIPSAYAFSLSSWYAEKTWRPVVAIGAGVSVSPDVGEAKNFPIQNPVTDEFYHYSASQPTQVSGLGDIFLGAEWNLQPNWALQAGVNYNQASSFSAKGTFVQGADSASADSYAFHYDVLAKQLLLEGKLLYTIKECYHPYILGGLGAAFNRAYDYYTNVPPNLTFTRMYSDNTTTSFSYVVGMGVDADVASNLRLGIGYRFADLGQVELGNATIDTSSVWGTLSQSHLYTNVLLAQLTWILS